MKGQATVALIITTGLLTSPLAGCATARGPRQLDAARPGGAFLEASWARVNEVAPAAEIQLRVRGSQPGRRYFVRAGASDLTVLNLSDATLPAASRRMLLDMASKRPESLIGVRTSGMLAEGDVRVGRDGLFEGNRKVADLGQVLQTVARSDIVEIRGPVAARGSVLGAVIGGYLGFAAGVVPGLGGAEKIVAWPVLIGSVALGAFLGSHWSSHAAEGVIYRVR